MPWSITVDISKAVAVLEKLANAAESTIPQQALQAGADNLAQSAASKAPVLTGALRDSIKVGGVSNTSATVEADVEYAGFVEFGTSKMSAEPYMTPGIPQASKVLVDTATRLLNEAIRD